MAQSQYLDQTGVSTLWGKVKTIVADAKSAGTTAQSNLTTFMNTKGAKSGLATLDANGRVPLEQLANLDTTVFLVVDKLPTENIKTNKIYVVKDSSTSGDLYQEYYYTNGAWEKLGTHQLKVDLDPYVLKDNLKTTLYKYLNTETGGDISGGISVNGDIVVDKSSGDGGSIIFGNPSNPFVRITQRGIKIGKYLIGEELAGGFLGTTDNRTYSLPEEGAGTLLTDSSYVIYDYGQRINALETKNTEQDTAIGNKVNTTDFNNYKTAVSNSLGDKADKTALNGYLPKTGGTLTGALNITQEGATVGVSVNGLTFKAGTQSQATTYNLPGSGGVIAVTSQIPSKLSQLTNDVVSAITADWLEKNLV